MKGHLAHALARIGLDNATRDAVQRLRALPRVLRRTDARIAHRHLAGADEPKLHIGCGTHLLDGWCNTDLTPRRPGVMRLNAGRRFPFADDTFAYVYSEYMIASLALPQAATMLRECCRVLAPGGKLRVATTDLAFLIALYRKRTAAGAAGGERTAAGAAGGQERTAAGAAGGQERTAAGAAGGKKTAPLDERYVRMATARRIAPCRHSLCQCSWPAAAAPGVFLNHHLHTDMARFVYDATALGGMLSNAGFSNVVRCEPSESQDAALRGLANEGRMPPGLLRLECLAMEGTKPQVDVP